MDFYVGQVFEDTYPPEAAVWCTKYRAYIDCVDGRYEIKGILPTGKPDYDSAEEIRKTRNSLLRSTDVYLVGDYPVKPEELDEIKVYRQKLREVPQQETFPEEVQWPEQPELVKKDLASMSD